jgi:ferrous iron transport protein B
MDNTYVIALAGNPNAGKTTVFNALTGARQKVGNWPGVTVERKEGKAKLGDSEVTVVDLPGIYSLTANSIDERIARDFITKQKPSLVAVVLDASNLERNLYLALQLMELGTSPVILIFNMMDEVENKGVQIDIEGLSKTLGVPIVPTAAKKNQGIPQLKKVLAQEISKERNQSVASPFKYKPSVEQGIERLTGTLAAESRLTQICPLRWLSIKLLEHDQEYLAQLEDSPIKSKVFEDLTLLKGEFEKKIGYDLETALVEERYGYINGLAKEFTKKKWGLAERLSLSDKIDKVLTNRILGLPIFFFFIWLTFRLTFDIGGIFLDYIDSFFGFLGNNAALLIQVLHGPDWLASLVQDGIIGGVGSVMLFLPNIFFLFFALSIMEETGYMARGAFIMDRVMHFFGLHGKSFIPMVIGFGCNVPAIMATRTLENPKDRIITILINPLMSCAARLPIYVLFAGAFFAEHQGMVIFSLYILGVVLAMLLARLFKTIFFKGEPAPLIMELPPYRLPSWKSLFLHPWHRSMIFVKKAGTIILATVVFIWFLASMPWGVEYASQQSIIGQMGSLLAPIFEPAGFGFWQAAVALFFGILAKEVVVGTLGTLYGTGAEGLGAVIAQHFTPVSAYAFMVMSLVYVPCIATIAAIKRETNSWKWTGFAIGYSLFLGWVLAVIVYQTGSYLF